VQRRCQLGQVVSSGGKLHFYCAGTTDAVAARLRVQRNSDTRVLTRIRRLKRDGKAPEEIGRGHESYRLCRNTVLQAKSHLPFSSNHPNYTSQ